MEKVLWVKFAWSDYYTGGPVVGNFSWLKNQKGTKNEGKGHEAYNFMPFEDNYYCYVPPQGGEHAPYNEDNKGWTVICLSKHPLQKGLHIVGWYKNATLIGDWLEHPSISKNSNKISSPYEVSYSIVSKEAYFIPPEHRTRPFSHDSIKQGKYSYLNGPNVKKDSKKNDLLSFLNAEILKLSSIAILNPNKDQNTLDPLADESDPLSFCGSAEHRKKVEKKAESIVINFYKEKGYTHIDATKLSCGYDFIFQKGNKIQNAEVKGTSTANYSFFLTQNELVTGLESTKNWKLAIVRNALSTNPEIKIFNGKEVRKLFELTPIAYSARFKPDT